VEIGAAYSEEKTGERGGGAKDSIHTGGYPKRGDRCEGPHLKKKKMGLGTRNRNVSAKNQ